VLKFAVSAGLATVISASIGVTTLCVSGLAGWDSFRSVWMTWWLGDLAGALVVAPDGAGLEHPGGAGFRYGLWGRRGGRCRRLQSAD
jgi:integral membrane sensor domain MASE1